MSIIIVISVLVLSIFNFSCSSSGDNIKDTQVGERRSSDPYLLYTSPAEASGGADKGSYFLSSDPKQKLLDAPYALSFRPKDIVTMKQYGNRESYDSFWEGDDELSPYIVKSPYIPDEVHDYLSIFDLYNKPKIRAFLVGNASYESESLRYSVNDIYLVSSFLEKALSVPKDSIFIEKNLTLSNFIKSFTNFASTVQDDELVLLYFSGHTKDDASPIFVDMKAINLDSFYSLLNSFNNDTVLIMDSSYLESDIGEDEVLLYDVKNVVELGSHRGNILRLYSNLVHRYNKEGKYKKHFMLRKYLRKTYSFLEELGVEKGGNGIFTLLLMSFFADFSHFSVPSLEVTYETVYAYINNILSSIEEERGRAEGVILARPKKYPIISANFENDKNDFILFRGSWDKGTFNDDNLVLRALYKKAVNLRQKKNYKLAANLFSNVLSLAGDYKQAKNLLASSYLSLASLSKRPDEAINFYKRSLRYNPDSVDALYGLAEVYKEIGDNDKAKSLFIEIEEKLANSEDVDKAFEAKLNKNLALFKKGELSGYELLKRGYKAYSKKEFDEALDYFVRARDAFKKENDLFYEATCINNIGSVYIVRGNYKKALELNFESLKIKDKIGDFEGIANTYNNIAVVYHKQKLYEKAIIYSNKSISLFNKLKFRDKLVAQSYINLSNSYLEVSNYGMAYVKQKEAVFILTRIRDFSLFKEKKKLIYIESKLL